MIDCDEWKVEIDFLGFGGFLLIRVCAATGSLKNQNHRITTLRNIGK